MIKTLISIDTDLKSSMAIRYAKDLSDRAEMMFCGFHVIEEKKASTSPGAGWVQKTWENAIIESKREEIQQLLDMENTSRTFLNLTRILTGDRTERLLEELESGEYDLFMEGMLPSFNPQEFYNVLHSRLYRLMPCPVLMVKNLLPTEKAALLFEPDTDKMKLASDFSNFFVEAANVGVDLIDLDIIKSKDTEIKERQSDAQSAADAMETLSQKKISAVSHRSISGSSKAVAEFLRQYGLVACSLSHKTKQHNTMPELLGRVQSPILICWQ